MSLKYGQKKVEVEPFTFEGSSVGSVAPGRGTAALQSVAWNLVWMSGVMDKGTMYNA